MGTRKPGRLWRRRLLGWYVRLDIGPLAFEIRDRRGGGRSREVYRSRPRAIPQVTAAENRARNTGSRESVTRGGIRGGGGENRGVIVLRASLRRRGCLRAASSLPQGFPQLWKG